MDSSALPVILIEVVLVFGGVLAFAWWQLRSVAHDRQKAADEARRRAAQAESEAGPPPPGGSA